FSSMVRRETRSSTRWSSVNDGFMNGSEAAPCCWAAAGPTQLRNIRPAAKTARPPQKVRQVNMFIRGYSCTARRAKGAKKAHFIGLSPNGLSHLGLDAVGLYSPPFTN